MGLIESTLKESLLRLSNKDSINVNEIRIKIFPLDDNFNPSYCLMKKTTIVRDVSLKEILNIGIIDVFGKQDLVKDFLKNKMKYLSKEYKIENINVRVFMKQNNEPSLYLFDGTKPITELTKKDLD